MAFHPPQRPGRKMSMETQKDTRTAAKILELTTGPTFNPISESIHPSISLRVKKPLNFTGGIKILQNMKILQFPQETVQENLLTTRPHTAPISLFQITIFAFGNKARTFSCFFFSSPPHFLFVLLFAVLALFSSFFALFRPLLTFA